jgi:rod shape-determining protein MreC
MIDFLWRYRRVVLVLLLVGMAAAVVAVQRKDEDDYNFFDRAIVRVTAPLQLAIDWFADRTSASVEHYVVNKNAATENDALHAELAAAKRELIRAEEARRENHRLLGLLNLLDRSHDTQYVAAKVVGRSPSPLFKSLRIDVGTDDGVQRGMGVGADSGVVGRVMAADRHYADVMLLSDAASSIDVYIARSRARGRLRGAGDATGYKARIDYLVRSANVEIGDEVMTTGAGVVFPKGLLIGWVVSVNKIEHGLYQEVRVEPVVPLTSLDEVMVIIGFGPDAIIDRPISSAASAPAPEEPDADPTREEL